MHTPWQTLLRASARTAALTAMDLATVGLWHPRLWVWRMTDSLTVSAGRGDRGRRFGQVLAGRRTGQPAQSFVQGSTPWRLLRRVGQWLNLGPGRQFVDVGAGEGYAAAVLALTTGAAGHAVEPVAALRLRAASGLAAARAPVQLVEFLGQVPVAQCHAAFAGWTMFDRDARVRVEDGLAALGSGSLVITVTHPVAHPAFEHRWSRRALFPWGPAELHLAARR